MKDQQMVKERIFVGTIEVIRSKGIKFTMDDLAKALAMSKKTIYVVFPDKGTLLLELVDYVFDQIRAEQEKVLSNESLDVVGKLRGILCLIPTDYVGMDLTQLYVLQGKFPEAYKRMNQRLESNWEPTFALMDEGVKQGRIKDVDHHIFQIAYETATERFLQGKELQELHISYEQALKTLVAIMVDGIIA